MRVLRQGLAVVALLTFIGVNAPPAVARSVGQVIDDTVVTTEVKAKLTAEKLSNLTKIEVKTEDGIVTLNGVVDTAGASRARRADRGCRERREGRRQQHPRGRLHDSRRGRHDGTTAGRERGRDRCRCPCRSRDRADDACRTAACCALTNQTVVWQPTTVQTSGRARRC